MPNCPNCGKPYNPGDEVCPECGLVLPFTTDMLTAGTILQGRYEIQELSHTGGMGYIYLAKDKRLYDRLCIVKQVKEPVRSDADLKKLEEEARRMAKLSHPNVAMILDHFVEGDYYFLVVERISGKTLSEVFAERHGQLMEDEVVSWAISICDVVSYIHGEGIVHRDISPDNIMLTKERSIKFVDFGTLRDLRYITTKGTAGMGKYGYTPPEQWQGRPVPQSDIFALGATIYYLLTGSLPLSKEYLSGQGPQRQDFSPSFPPIRTKNPSISPQLEAVLTKALQLDVSNRYTSAAEFGQVLRSLEKATVLKYRPVEEAKLMPVLSVDAERLNFADVIVGTRATRTLTVRNTGTGRLTGKITTSHPWLKVSPTRIDLETGEQTVLVTVDARYLYWGVSVEGNINIDTNGGAANVDVSLSTAATIAKPAKELATAGTKRRNWLLFIIIGFIVLVPLLVIGRNISNEWHIPMSIKTPKLAVNLESIDFADIEAGASSTKELALSNSGGGTLTGTLTTTKQWLKVEPATINLSTTSQTIKLTVDTTGLSADLNDTGIVSINTNGGNADVPVTLSVCTNKIAFVSGSDGNFEIYVMNVNGSNQTRLTYNDADDCDPAWSPDGRKIAFYSNRDGNHEIYVMNADGSSQTRLTYNTARDWQPVWSPDGRKIAFASDRSGYWQIYVMNADGSNQARLTHSAWTDWVPAWSPDGRKIAFVSDRDGNSEIYVMKSDGTNQIRLTYNDAGDRDPTWSPDGTRIAFSSHRDGDEQVYIMNSDGSNQSRLTYSSGYNWYSGWSPGGEKIAFSSTRTGTHKIYVMNRDGSNQTQVPHRGNGWRPVWSPKCTRTGGRADSAVPAVTATAAQSATSTLPATMSPIQAIPVWRALLLVYRSIDVDYINNDGEPYHMTYTMPESQVDKAIRSFRQYASFAYDYSNGEAFVKYDIVHITRPITSLTARDGNDYWISPDDTCLELNKYVLPRTYDSVFIFWPKIDFETGQEIPSSGWGLAIGPSEWSNGATYATVHNASDSVWEDPTVGEVWLHEWLHGVCNYYASKGYRMPTGDADGGEKHGYKHSSTTGWGSYYRDLMTSHVLEDGAYTGIIAQAWRSGSITGCNLAR